MLIAIAGSLAPRSTRDAERSPSSREDHAQSQVHDDLSLFISKYGRPGSEDGTEYDNPRPPIVTHWIVYRPERVQAIYYPDAPVTSPPPYGSWKLMGFTDLVTNEALTPDEAVRRLEGRRRR